MKTLPVLLRSACSARVVFGVLLWILAGGAPAPAAVPVADRADGWTVGVARIDITPDYPVRLAGYASRKAESEGVAQRIYAKAMAIGSDAQGPAVLITVDNCGVPANIRNLVLQRLRPAGVGPGHLAICSTHSHSTPWLAGYLGNLFSGPIPADQQARVERYTRELTEALGTVALAALRDRRPATLAWGRGRAGFAANRRTPGGPVDQDLPALFVTGPEGKLRAVFANYACHCTTLTGEFNQVCGDWAGYAAEGVEAEHPGALALIAIGCGGDANPNPRPGFDLARRHGRELAVAIGEILGRSPLPLPPAKLRCRRKEIDLPLAALPPRAEWERRARQADYAGAHARLNLARLDRGEKLATSVPYIVQTWTFGDRLAMVFLAGEVVVDYSLRLKREYDGSRLWINAYANDVPCYIPSERILREGGYEGEVSMIFYDQPAPFAAGIEERVARTVRQLTPRGYRRLFSAAE